MTQNDVLHKPKKHPRRKVYSARCLTIGPREAAVLTGLGVSRVYRLLRAGIMPSIPDPGGKSYRIPRAALLDWLRGCRGQPVELQDDEAGRLKAP
jgi:excisionase family DNA binding protein